MPADLADRYWWTIDGDAGHVGTTAQIGLPAGERILTVEGGLVVSARPSFNSHFAPADLIVRDMRTGDLLRQIASNVGFPYAELVGRQLFWAGMEPSSNADAGRFVDGGVWTARIDDTLTPEVLVRSGRNLTTMGNAERRPLLLSPSGLTLASTVSGSASAFTDVIDTSTLDVRTRLDDADLFALTDDTFVVGDSPLTESPDGRGLIGRDLATGATLWTFPEAANKDRFSLLDMEQVGTGFLIEYSWRTRNGQIRLASLDARTGDARSLLVQRANQSRIRYAAFSISSVELIALVPELGPIGSLIQSGTVTVSTLDIATREITNDAFVIDPPWLCYPTSCLRD